MKLWINNLPPHKSDEDVREFVRKYTRVEISAMFRIDDGGASPGVLLEIEGASGVLLMGMQRRLHRMYWDLHALAVQVMSFADRG
jgi:hypothetical protein